jgi:hypothetical protein
VATKSDKSDATPIVLDQGKVTPVYTSSSVDTIWYRLDPNANYGGDETWHSVTWNGGACPVHHTVTYGSTTDCDKGWTAFYQIDGKTSVTYASGTWTLETVSVPAYDLKDHLIAGDTYNITQIPAVTITEPGNCLKKKVTATAGPGCEQITLTVSTDTQSWRAKYNPVNGAIGPFWTGGPFANVGDNTVPAQAAGDWTVIYFDGDQEMVDITVRGVTACPPPTNPPTPVVTPTPYISFVPPASGTPRSTSTKSTSLTPPPTSGNSGGSSGSNSSLLFVLLICAVPAAIGTWAVQSQRRKYRR